MANPFAQTLLRIVSQNERIAGGPPGAGSVARCDTLRPKSERSHVLRFEEHPVPVWRDHHGQEWVGPEPGQIVDALQFAQRVAETARMLSAAQFARGLAVDGKTVARYLDLLGADEERAVQRTRHVTVETVARLRDDLITLMLPTTAA